jgi:hypothetical protein
VSNIILLSPSSRVYIAKVAVAVSLDGGLGPDESLDASEEVMGYDLNPTDLACASVE